jgi:hypothetical protein
MFKVFFSAALVCISLTAQAENLGSWIPFAKEYKFAAEAIAREQSLNFWALPMAEDSEGITAARAMITEMDTINYRENPFLVKFNLAGVKYAFDNQTSTDPLVDTVEGYLNQAQDAAYIRCKGYYSEIRIAHCFVDHENQESLQKELLIKGYLLMNQPPVDIPEDHLQALQRAQDEAKFAEIGIWKPFFFMLQGIQSGQLKPIDVN